MTLVGWDRKYQLSHLRIKPQLFSHFRHLWHRKGFRQTVTALVFGTDETDDQVTVLDTALEPIAPVGQGTGTPRPLTFSQANAG